MKRLFFVCAFFALTIGGAEAAARFGICATTCTWDNASTAMWSDSSGGATGFSAPTTVDTVTFDGNTCVGGTTCTITVNANLSINSLAMGTCTASTTGCILDFSANNNNIIFGHAATSFNIGGTGVRRLNMGSGTWSFANVSTATMWNSAPATNLTLNANSSTIVTNHTNTTATVTFSTDTTLTLNNLTINANSSIGTLLFVGGPINFTNLTINAPNYIDFNGGGQFNITTLNVNGTAITNNIGLFFPQFQVSSTVVATYAWLRGGVCNTVTFASSVNGGLNSGCLTTAPAGSTTACILGGWLLWRDMPGNLNDNFPAWLDKAA